MSKVLNRMASLLALAENDGASEAERALAFQRAQELASATGIDLAIARAHQRDRDKREDPEKRSFKLGDYVRVQNNKWKVDLFRVVAGPNDVRLTIGSNNIYVWAHGFPSDIAVAEKIYAVAVVRMIGDADLALKNLVNYRTYTDWEVVYDPETGLAKRDENDKMVRRSVKKYESMIDGRIWRSNFYKGYIQQLGARLWDGRREALKKAGALKESSATALVVRDKVKEVEDFYTEHTKHSRGSWSPPEASQDHYGGFEAGAAAATRTDLQDGSSVEANQRQALS